MRLLIQRVQSASVTVDGTAVGRIGRGLLLLVGFEGADTDDDLQWAAHKVVNLRIFPDDDGKMNRSLLDVAGEALVVSQFTLHAQVKKGFRPSFVRAAPPDVARRLYRRFIDLLGERLDGRVAEGVFGAYMKVALVNDGPVTIWIDTQRKE